MKRVLITGATGMIGATLIKRFARDGIYVTAIARPNSLKLKNIPVDPKVEVVECDINKLSGLTEKLQGMFDTFYHFAWDGTYGSSREDEYLQERNIKNTLEAVTAAKSLGCETFIGAGSQAEFGFVQGSISDEKPKNPVTGYGIAKYAAGKLSRNLCEQYGMRHCWGRIVSTFGPMDNEYTMVMSSIVNMLKGKRMSFTRGEQEWDYLYSEDCAEAFYKIGLSGKHGKAYTIASGKSRKLSEYITVIRNITFPSLEIGLGELKYYPNQVMKLRGDIGDLTEDTGFYPQVSFEEGIKRTIEWYRGTIL